MPREATRHSIARSRTAPVQPPPNRLVKAIPSASNGGLVRKGTVIVRAPLGVKSDDNGKMGSLKTHDAQKERELKKVLVKDGVKGASRARVVPGVVPKAVVNPPKNSDLNTIKRKLPPAEGSTQLPAKRFKSLPASEAEPKRTVEKRVALSTKPPSGSLALKVAKQVAYIFEHQLPTIAQTTRGRQDAIEKHQKRFGFDHRPEDCQLRQPTERVAVEGVVPPQKNAEREVVVVEGHQSSNAGRINNAEVERSRPWRRTPSPESAPASRDRSASPLRLGRSRYEVVEIPPRRRRKDSSSPDPLAGVEAVARSEAGSIESAELFRRSPPGRPTNPVANLLDLSPGPSAPLVNGSRSEDEEDASPRPRPFLSPKSLRSPILAFFSAKRGLFSGSATVEPIEEESENGVDEVERNENEDVKDVGGQEWTDEEIVAAQEDHWESKGLVSERRRKQEKAAIMNAVSPLPGHTVRWGNNTVIEVSPLGKRLLLSPRWVPAPLGAGASEPEYPWTFPRSPIPSANITQHSAKAKALYNNIYGYDFDVEMEEGADQSGLLDFVEEWANKSPPRERREREEGVLRSAFAIAGGEPSEDFSIPEEPSSSACHAAADFLLKYPGGTAVLAQKLAITQSAVLVKAALKSPAAEPLRNLSKRLQASCASLDISARDSKKEGRETVEKLTKRFAVRESELMARVKDLEDQIASNQAGPSRWSGNSGWQEGDSGYSA